MPDGSEVANMGYVLPRQIDNDETLMNACHLGVFLGLHDLTLFINQSGKKVFSI